MGISIHALVKRATFFDVSFNASYVISIHALVKRATLYRCENCVIVLYFNPRPRKEGDRVGVRLIKVNRSISIHALVKRATGRKRHMVFVILYFNPRPRKEGDTAAYGRLLFVWISIHALVKRAT